MCDHGHTNVPSESSLSSSSASPSEGEYTLPNDEHCEETSGPVFDIQHWNPEPPAGLQYFTLLPIHQGYDALQDHQHNSVCKILPTTQHRKHRSQLFASGKITGRNIHDGKLLRNAVNAANYKLVEELLDRGVEPSSMDDKKRSPLHIAAAMGSKDMVQVLLLRGADPNQKDIIGNTPLHLAACTSHIQVVTLLLQAGTDVNALDNAGNSPLHLARSRLCLLRENSDKPSTDRIKEEVSHIVNMMKEYMLRRGSQVEDLGELDQLRCQLSKVHTQDDLDQISALLTGFANLQIQKNKPG